MPDTMLALRKVAPEQGLRLEEVLYPGGRAPAGVVAEERVPETVAVDGGWWQHR